MKLTYRADLLLLLAALIWGLAFVAQRAGMSHVGPYTFNAVRFTLGALVLVPFLSARRRGAFLSALPGGAQAGLALFLGASLQQWGLLTTSAGKGGFITGLYVIVVPVLGAMEGRRTGWGTWLGAVMAAGGLALLSLNRHMRFSHGDLLVLAGALIWAMHVLIIGRLMERFDALLIAFQQFALVALLSLGAALLMERGEHQGLLEAALPLVYAGVLSTGVAFTLQVLAQRQAPPSHAAVLLSLESVFAALGGWLLLGERLGGRGLAGCGLMLAGMLSTQLLGRPRRARRRGGSEDPPLVRPTL